MHVPALIFHDDFFEYSPTIIGDEAARLGKLADPYVPLAPVVCVTKETLLEIAQYNNVQRFLETYAKTTSVQTQAKTELKDRFFQQIFPESIKIALLEWHLTIIKDSFTKVFTSHTSGTTCHIQREHVLGDSNTLQSIFEVWWEALQPILETTTRPLSPLDLVPTAICIQKESIIESSGVAYSIHPHTGSKNIVLIEAVYGVYQNHISAVAANVEVDLGQSKIETVQDNEQTEMLIQTSDALQTRPLKPTTSLVISEKTAHDIATLTQKIKKKFIDQVAVYWILTSSGLEIINVEPFYFDHKRLQKNTHTKLVVTAGNPHKLHEYKTMHCDGVFFKSDYFFMSQGVHPQHLLKSTTKRASLEKEFLSLLQTLQKTRHSIWYQPLHLDSKNLKSLAYSEIYEPLEENPLLGFNGALKALHMPEVFIFELSVLEKFCANSQQNVHFCLPTPRSAREYTHILETVHSHLKTKHASLFLPLCIPSQVFDFENYIRPELKGYILDIDLLRALLHGYDPENQEVAGHYSQSNTLFETIIPQIVQKAQECNQETYVSMTTFSTEILEFALQAHATGVIIKPKNSVYAKEYILEFERRNRS